MILEDHTRKISVLTFSPDGKILALGDVEGAVWLWDVAQGQGNLFILPSGARVLDLAFSPKGAFLAVTNAKGRGPFLTVWGVTSGKMVKSFSDYGDRVFSLSETVLIASVLENPLYLRPPRVILLYLETSQEEELVGLWTVALDPARRFLLVWDLDWPQTLKVPDLLRREVVCEIPFVHPVRAVWSLGGKMLWINSGFYSQEPWRSLATFYVGLP